ncbi:M20/M25/M40 family metallo-hydrolase [Streptacidiphilus jiangxiensis]|uniref:Glutamate carboxypeptidase n=1 Tax=Streptacidiphilus jiangxiensis TaxID=235985 RepID=A0A1H7XAP8_STRJI|nr:M20/M25/M40 family metallo-hydrolase [Streptacidiphilus jiangxiensis]SEM30109.1 glutamate carboxypeptidase [Streptacidiphilus jiangxiensis]
MTSVAPDLHAILADLEQLVAAESFSADHQAVAASARTMAAVGTRLLGEEPELLVVDGVTHVRWTFGTTRRVLLLGHHDTVWPIGSLATHPWRVHDGIATGPGIFDMKAGLVQLLHAVASLTERQRDGITIVVTGDEKAGGATSRALIEEAARGCRATFVLEASAADGALKTARKGVSWYEIVIGGRAAHAGLESDKGVNAAVEAAHQILALVGLPDWVSALTGNEVTTVTPTLVTAGTTGNTVPDAARISVDVRVPTRAAQHRIDELIRRLQPVHPGATVTVTGGPNWPPLEPAHSAALFDGAEQRASLLGLGPLWSVSVGGASGGNFTAGVGCLTLDGLGAVGGGAHADHEHIVIRHLPDRTRLLAALITETNR